MGAKGDKWICLINFQNFTYDQFAARKSKQYLKTKGMTEIDMALVLARFI